MITSGHAGGLEYDLSLPEGVADGATVAVLLHGRGSHKGDLQALGPVLPEGWALVTPQAPYPGPEWGYGPGWAWYRHVEEDRVVQETLDGSLELLDGFLGALPELLGLAPGRIVMGGFSQGGTMSRVRAHETRHPDGRAQLQRIPRCIGRAPRRALGRRDAADLLGSRNSRPQHPVPPRAEGTVPARRGRPQTRREGLPDRPLDAS